MEAVKWAANFPILQYGARFTHDLAAGILRTGPIPNHIAFVMDGNRRFAKKYTLESGEGHFAGFEAFLRVLQACAKLGVKTVTVYAFSIENFNRSKEEADLLFDLVRTRVWDLVKDQESAAHKHGWKIKVWGNRAMLEKDILERIEKIEDLTQAHTKMVVNICCPYTSRDDMAQATKHFAEDAVSRRSSPPHISEKSFEEKTYIGQSSEPLDILIRTSGETRLSDFMCWEAVENCQIEFVSTLWPEFSVWELYSIVLRWGYNQTRLANFKSVSPEQLPAAPPLVSVSVRANVSEKKPVVPRVVSTSVGASARPS